MRTDDLLGVAVIYSIGQLLILFFRDLGLPSEDRTTVDYRTRFDLKCPRIDCECPWIDPIFVILAICADREASAKIDRRDTW